MDTHDNEKGQSLDKYQAKGGRYVLFPLLPQKESNRPTNLGEETRSLTHLVYIPKLPYHVIAKFALEFPGGGGSKAKKKIYTSHLQEEMEFHSASTASTASGTTNPCRLIRERLESHPPSNHCQGLATQPCPNQRQGSGSHLAAIASRSFTNASNIPNVILSPTKFLATGNSLWRGHRRRAGIKDSTSAACSLCKVTWEVMICMVLTGEGRLGPDIWPEPSQQAESTKSMMRAT